MPIFSITSQIFEIPILKAFKETNNYNYFKLQLQNNFNICKNNYNYNEEIKYCLMS